MPNEVKKVPKKCQTHPEKRQKNAKAFLNSVLLRIYAMFATQHNFTVCLI